MEQWFAAVTDFLAAHRNEMVSDLQALARIPSISHAGADGLPFGKAVDEALTAAAALYTKHGIPMQVKHDRGYALAVCDGEGDGIGLFGHADVVPVNDDWVMTAPFEPVEKDGVLYGRGVNDNKAGVIGSLYALRALKAAGVPLRRKLTVYVGGSEETGMQDMAAFVAHERMPAVSLIPDSDFPVSVGEKGILRVDCRSRQALTSVTKFEGGQAYNVVLDKVEVVPTTGNPFTVQGLTAHAAHPEGSVNAAHKAAVQLLESGRLSADDRTVFEALRTALGDCYGEALGIASEGVFGKLTCVNGIVRVEHGRLFFTLDIRYGNEFDAEAGIKQLTAALSALGFEATVGENDPGFLLDEGGAEMACILQSYREAAGQPDAQPYKTFGGTYARRVRNAFAVNHSAPFDKTGLGLPAGHGGAHQSDECLSADAWLTGTAALALAIARLDTCDE